MFYVIVYCNDNSGDSEDGSCTEKTFHNLLNTLAYIKDEMGMKRYAGHKLYILIDEVKVCS